MQKGGTLKKKLHLVKWIVSGSSVISARSPADAREQFDRFEFEDIRTEVEKKEIVKIEEYRE